MATTRSAGRSACAVTRLPAAHRIGATQNAATAHGAPPIALFGAVSTTIAMPPNPAASRTCDATDTGVPINPLKSTTHSGIVAARIAPRLAVTAVSATIASPCPPTSSNTPATAKRLSCTRVGANAVQLLAGGTVLLLLALSLGELDPARWSDVSSISVGAAVFLLVFDSLVGFMLYARLLASAPAPLVSTYAYVTPLVGAVMGATVLDEPLWAGAFVGAALVLGAVALELRGR